MDTGPAVSTSDPSFVRGLEAQVSMVPDWRFSVLRLSVVGLMAAVGIWLITTGSVVGAVIAVLLLAIVDANLVYGQHECLHRGLFAHKWPNDALGLLMGVLMGVPYAGYRRYHLQHHAHTHEEGDTEPALVLTSVWMWAGYMAGVAHGQRIESALQLPAALRSRNRTTRRLAILSTLLLVVMLAAAVYLAVAHTRFFVLAWALPWLVGAPFMAYITLADHHGCGWGPDSPLKTTRATNGNWLSRFIAWDGNYHAGHHLSAAVPTSSLSAFHHVLQPHLIYQERSFVHFHVALLRDLWAKRIVPAPPWRTVATPPPSS
jgi:fatty acid desaturase